MQPEYTLKATNIDKSFKFSDGRLKVLNNINLKVAPGQFVCLIGPSGCGKSTLLRILSNLIKPDAGKVIVNDSTRLSFVFQNFGLFPWLTVSQNIGYGLKMQGKDKDFINAEVTRQISQMGLAGFEDKHPKELSGGMKQRVGIARALAVKPDILLLDEPFSALDSFTADRLRKDLLKIWKENKLTIIMVSHLIEEAIELSDQIIVLSSKPGTVKKEVDIKLARPRSNRSKEFFEYVDQLAGLIDQN